jgi:hypothetical protein
LVSFEVADLVETLYNSIVEGAGRAPEHGRNGYYFVANGDVEFEKLTEIVETRAGTRRVFTHTELKTYFPSVRVHSQSSSPADRVSMFFSFSAVSARLLWRQWTMRLPEVACDGVEAEKDYY